MAGKVGFHLNRLAYFFTKFMYMDVLRAATAALDGAAYKIWEPRYLTKFASGKAAPLQKLHCSLAVRSSQGSLLVLYPEGPSTQ